MKKKIFAMILCLAVGMLAGCGRTGIKFGTSGAGGTYGEVARAIADNIDDISFDIRETAGSAANVRLLSQDYLDIAIAQSDVVNNAYNGIGMFAGSKSYRGYAAVAGLYTEACQIIVGASSDINDVDELAGKTVSIGEAESGTEQNAVQILQAYGLNKSFVDEVNLSYKDACEQLKAGKIDALFCTLAPNSPVFKELAEEYDIRLISLTDRTIERLLDAYGYYTEYTIAAGTYRGQTEDVKTVGVTAVLLANEKMDNDKVKEIAGSIFDNRDKINADVTAELELSPERAVTGISIPFHEGAVQYYETLGIDAARAEQGGGER